MAQSEVHPLVQLFVHTDNEGEDNLGGLGNTKVDGNRVLSASVLIRSLIQNGRSLTNDDAVAQYLLSLHESQLEPGKRYGNLKRLS